MRMTVSRAIVGWVYVAPCLLGVVLVTAVMGGLATRVGIDNAVEIWFLDDDPTLVAYQDFQVTFGNDEVVALAVHDPDGVLDREGLELIRELGERAEAVEGIAEARSVTTELTIQAGEALIDIAPLVPEDLDQVRDWELQRQRILDDPLVRGVLVNEEGTTALVLARMEAMEGIDARRDGILAELEQATSDLPHRTAGIGVVYAALNHMATVDSAVFIGASYGLIIVLLLLVFGRFTPMAVSMGVVGVGAIWLLGAFGAAGRDINMVTMVLPTLVVIIGISDCIHILNHVAGAPGEDRRERVVEGVSFMFWPCLFNTLTTVMAFMALVAAPMAVIRDMGLFAAVGLMCAFVLAIVGCTVALRWEAAEPRATDSGVLQAGVRALSELGIRRPRGVLAAAVAGSAGDMAAGGFGEGCGMVSVDDRRFLLVLRLFYSDGPDRQLQSFTGFAVPTADLTSRYFHDIATRLRSQPLSADQPLEVSVLDEAGVEIYRTGPSLLARYIHEAPLLLSLLGAGHVLADPGHLAPAVNWAVRSGYPGTSAAALARSTTNRQRQLLVLVTVVAAVGIVLSGRACRRTEGRVHLQRLARSEDAPCVDPGSGGHPRFGRNVVARQGTPLRQRHRYGGP